MTTSPRVPPAVSSRRTTGMPAAGGSMSMPAAAIIFGIEPRDAMPMPAHAVQSMRDRARRRARRAELRGPLAEQIVGRAVVGLAAIAEAAGDRAEGDDGAERQVAGGTQQVEPAIAS